MDESDWLAERFEAHRTHLGAVAYRTLGSVSEAHAAGVGTPRVVIGFTISCGKITEIDLVADPERLSKLDLAVLTD